MEKRKLEKEVELILEELFSYTAKGIKLGLDNMKGILGKLGNPEKKSKIIHVAGTNGKGSTVSMIAGGLEAKGFKVGKYTSPHIEKFNERISINRENITDQEIINYYLKVKDAIKEGKLVPTFFEITTAMMFLYFADQSCDYIVLEVGLGGRYDATNLITPEVAVITNISKDHTSFLGDTLEEIAFEKTGIIKPKAPVVLCNPSKELREEAEKEGKESLIIDVWEKYRDKNYTPLENFQSKIDFSIDGKKKKFIIPLYGKHQMNNFLQAYEVLNILGVDDETIQRGVETVRWPGRFEVSFQGDKIIILDGAHNWDSARILQENLLKKYKKDELVGVVSVLKDKNQKEIFEIFKDTFSSIIFTSLSDYHRGTTGKKQLEILEDKTNLSYEEDLEKAMEKALKLKKVVVVCGSFYLLGKYKKIMRRVEND